MGIVGLLACAPIGIAAWVMANQDLQPIREGVMDPDGESLTEAGKIMGIIATALFALQFLGVTTIVAVIILGMAA